jgi:hypothetical protein
MSGTVRAGNASGSGLETRQAQVKMVKEMSYHHGCKSGSLLWLREVILRPGNVAAIQATRPAHLRLETRQAQSWKRVRLQSNAEGGVIPPWQ